MEPRDIENPIGEADFRDQLKRNSKEEAQVIDPAKLFSDLYAYSKTLTEDQFIDHGLRYYKIFDASATPTAGLRWVKASERLPDKFKDVIVRSFTSNRVKVTQNMTHNTGWDIAMELDFEYDRTEWLDESAPTAGLREALDEIIHPIKYMKQRLQDGEQLHGINAIALSNDAHYLRSIAKKALENQSESGTPVDGYWKKRCEAAEFLLSRVDNNINKQFVGYKEWQDIVSKGEGYF